MLNKFSLSVPYSNVWRAVYRTFVQKRNGKIKENDDKCFALVKGSNIIVIFMIIIAIFFVYQTERCKFKKKRHWLDEKLVSEIQTNNLTENLVFLTDIIKRKIIDLNWKKKKSVILLKRHYQSIFWRNILHWWRQHQMTSQNLWLIKRTKEKGLPFISRSEGLTKSTRYLLVWNTGRLFRMEIQLPTARS